MLKKEPMGKDISESDVFSFNEEFHNKLYKIKIATVSAQKESEPEKQETRHKVGKSEQTVFTDCITCLQCSCSTVIPIILFRFGLDKICQLTCLCDLIACCWGIVACFCRVHHFLCVSDPPSSVCTG